VCYGYLGLSILYPSPKVFMAQSESGGIGGHFHGLRAVRVFLTWCSPVVAWAVRHLPLSSRRGANGQVSRCLTPPGRAASGYIRESSPAQPRNHLDLQRTVPSISSLSIHQQGRTLTSTPPPNTPHRTNGHDLRLFRFDMAQPIPIYLVALVVGDLVSAEIGPRSSVWTEPTMLEACRVGMEGGGHGRGRGSLAVRYLSVLSIAADHAPLIELVLHTKAVHQHTESIRLHDRRL
jgi:hypothetical protein